MTRPDSPRKRMIDAPIAMSDEERTLIWTMVCHTHANPLLPLVGLKLLRSIRDNIQWAEEFKRALKESDIWPKNLRGAFNGLKVHYKQQAGEKMAVKPIKPSEVVAARKTVMPDGVIEAFNELIVRNFRNEKSVIQRKMAEKLICEKMNVTYKEVFDNHWLDVEDIFREAGWDVEYDQPGYNESYEAAYTFTVANK